MLINPTKFITNYLNQISIGYLIVLFPDGSKKYFGDSQSNLQTELHIKDYSLLKNLLLRGEIALGEGYINGLWECDNIANLLKLFVLNFQQTGRLKPKFQGLFTLLDKITHRFKRNTITKAKDNISAHYDLGNDFFQTFLDKNMVYSCGIFNNNEDSLEVAQKNKIKQIIAQSNIQPGQRILEIGCGWGAFSLTLAQEMDVSITAITISEEQYYYVKDLVAKYEVTNRIEVKLEDYRNIEGQYDRIVSIEMLEAVGHEGLTDFFTQCSNLLSDNGLLSIQVITMPDSRYESYRKNVDFIQKYVFPGGHLPSLGALNHASSIQNSFSLQNMNNIGTHYAKTLFSWNQNLQQNKQKIVELGYPERLIKIWEYYFGYCQVGFETYLLDNLQLIYSK
jgi:cyclopropane-fatty-acyl-phospholipid synthase